MTGRNEKRKNMFKRSFAGLLVMLVFILCSCGGRDENEGVCRVFFLDKNEEKLVSEEYTLQANKLDISSVVSELIHELQTNGKDDTFVNPIEPDIEFKDFQIRENQLSLYFSAAYNNTTGISEILSRAAIVKTLCQVEGVDKVDFFVEDQPLMIRGENVGQMDESSFVEDLSSEGEPQTRVVRLYFSDASGQMLVPVDTEVTFPAAEKMAEILVNRLIAGPGAITDANVSNLLRTIPPESVLNNMTIRDNICYLDFSREFMELLPDVTSDVTVYSIVNTICELPSISRVQFTINSGVRDRYGETSGFNQSMQRNLDIIRNDETESEEVVK